MNWKHLFCIGLVGLMLVAALACGETAKSTEANSQPKAFLSWAKSVGIIDTDGKGNPKKLISFEGQKLRCVVILREWGMEDEFEADQDDDNPFK